MLRTLFLLTAFLTLIGWSLAHPEPLMLPVTLAGLCIGSFLNVVIYRLPLMEERRWRQTLQMASGSDATPFNLAVPRSRCPYCGHAITALENIPVLSYLWLRGHCSSCHATISVRYPLIELLTGALTALALSMLGFTPAGAMATVFCWFAVAAAMIDWDTQTLPDQLTLSLLWVGLAMNSLAIFVEPSVAIAGAALGYLGLYVLKGVVTRAVGAEAMGQGDLKLAAAIGAVIGPTGLLLTLMLASLSALVSGVLFAARRKQPLLLTSIPFGPFLVAGAFVVMLADTVRMDFSERAVSLLRLLAS